MERITLVIFIFFMSCKTQFTNQTVNDRTFSTISYHMVGPSTIRFVRDSFYYNEYSGGTIYSFGTYEINSKEKEIILKSRLQNDLASGLNSSSRFIDLTNQKMKIKDKKELIFRNQVFRRK